MSHLDVACTGMEQVVAEELRHPAVQASAIEFISMKAGVDFWCIP